MSLLQHLRGQLIVSCQASVGSPFRDTAMICAFAQAAMINGAAGLRLEGLTDVQAVREQQSAPIIGIIKHSGREVFITPDLEDVRGLAAAGADIVAFDGTERTRPVSVADLITACHDVGAVAMADISTAAEGLAAWQAGADFVGTTLSGYTPYTQRGAEVWEGPDLALIRELSDAGVRVVAEGHIRTPAQARAALEAGAYAVVVGSAITRPDDITRWFAEEVQRANRS
ncbi:N-acetylmannosamine-6-phosphate 2-epimerase [Deinococcus arenicola]|uniref:Putative N-acetylmannosamine-6-phosphate 2-epimerase n=1 Tax=Deinococcus arenicola TaxID=2994950 RepID=A0ABU4DP63_9DEIO|nr:N-acetylmannosamine-6-phosphate 2-epimerase [Deinococcus sp. ZS9-10]MDV6374223.1 N-acetylmannosamine-6-phosphate 2-epimerase [Deinococcus sp. ZS9-10]